MVPCLEDLADADLWAAIDNELVLWEGKAKVQWTRSHPERRKQKQAWNRDDIGNSWSDLQADDAMVALETTLADCSSRLELVDPNQAGCWSVAWEGTRIISAVNKSIRAALMADSFGKYLSETRGWPANVMQHFSRERWASKLVMLRAAANATVITKMITGWLASQSGMMKRGQIDLAVLREEEIMSLGLCRLCGTGPETNWHVQAECTHPQVVAERRAASLEVIGAIEKLHLPLTVAQLLSTQWLLDEQGRAHDLSDLQELEDILSTWAPDLADRAASIQQQLVWDCKQGTHKDDLRKWAFRGLMLGHWTRTMGELGVPGVDARSALNKIELAVLHSFPGVWTMFSALTHEDRPAEHGRRNLDLEVDAIFEDWATDQRDPIPITRSEVNKLTDRAKRKWITARKRDIRKRRATQHRFLTTQRLIIGYMTVTHTAGPALLARIRSAAYTGAITNHLRARRKRWTQQVMRDHGFEPRAIQAAVAAHDPPKQTQTVGPPNVQSPANPDGPETEPVQPRVERSHPLHVQATRIMTAAQRRHRDRARPTAQAPRTAPASELDRNIALDIEMRREEQAPPSPTYRPPLETPSNSANRTYQEDLRD